MKNNITMPVVSINRHRLKTNGVGVTTLVASFGCPLTCKYCINKRTWDPAMLPKCVQMTPEQLYDKLKIDDLYFIATGGGITFGGGESLLHSDFIAAFREVCGDKWQITVETSLNGRFHIFFGVKIRNRRHANANTFRGFLLNQYL